MKRRDFGLLLLLALMWSTSFLFIKLGVESIPPMVFVSGRLLLGAVILYGVMLLQGYALPRDRATWKALAVIGLTNAALPFSLYSWGEQHISSGLAAIYNATTPLWTVLLAQLWAREERLTPLRSLGVLLGFCGIVWLVSDDLRQIWSTSFLAQLACLVAGAAYAYATLYARRRLYALPPIVQVVGQLTTGLLWLLPLVLLNPSTYSMQPSTRSLLSMLALAVLGNALGLVLFFYLLGRVGATRTTQVTYIMPIFGLLWGWLFLSERVEPRMIVGLLIILLGVVAVSGRLPRLRRPGSSSADQHGGDEHGFDSQRSSGDSVLVPSKEV